jgi:hypothetical protein
MSLSTTSVPEIPGETPAPARRAVAIFAAAVILGVGLGAFAMLMGPVQGYLHALKRGAPLALQPHVDTLLVPFWAGFLAAALIGLATSLAPPVLQRWPSARTALAWACVVLGLAGCGLMYWWGGYVLPYASRRALFGPGGVYRYSAEFPPYLLTNEELAHVQTFLRRQGGYSPRVALMWQLRLWCALILPVAGLLAAIAVIRMRSGMQLAWLFGTQVVVAGLWLIGTMVAVGPAAFARPTAVPQQVAWAILAALTVAAAVVFRLALAALENAEYQRVLDALARDREIAPRDKSEAG